MSSPYGNVFHWTLSSVVFLNEQMANAAEQEGRKLLLLRRKLQGCRSRRFVCFNDYRLPQLISRTYNFARIQHVFVLNFKPWTSGHVLTLLSGFFPCFRALWKQWPFVSTSQRTHNWRRRSITRSETTFGDSSSNLMTSWVAWLPFL